MHPFRILMTAVTIAGLIMLTVVLAQWQGEQLTDDLFSGVLNNHAYDTKSLLLALPVPLHVIFIGLIMQKKWLSPGWARFAWVGITGSGIWLGISLLYRTFA